MSNNINNLNGGFGAVNFNGKKQPKEIDAPQNCKCPECETTVADSNEALAAYNMPCVGKQCKPLTREELENCLQEFDETYLDASFEALNQYALEKYGA